MAPPTTTIELERSIAKALDRVAQLERVDDPGVGLPAREAKAAREKHLRAYERASDELVQLRRQWDSEDPA